MANNVRQKENSSGIFIQLQMGCKAAEMLTTSRKHLAQ